MAMTTYVVPDHGIGATHHLVAINVDTEAVEALLRQAGLPVLETPATLAEAPSSNGFLIQSHGRTIGELSEDDRQDYPDLECLIAAGLTPEVTVRLMPTSHASAPAVLVLVPAPGLCVPLNEPPAGDWALMQPITAHPVDFFPTVFDCDLSDRMHLLISLTINESGQIEAYLGAKPIGILAGSALDQLARTVTELEHQGLTPVARAFHTVTPHGPTTTVYTSTPADVTTLPVNPLPSLHTLLPTEEEVDAPQPPTPTRPNYTASADAARAARELDLEFENYLRTPPRTPWMKDASKRRMVIGIGAVAATMVIAGATVVQADRTQATVHNDAVPSLTEESSQREYEREFPYSLSTAERASTTPSTEPSQY